LINKIDGAGFNFGATEICTASRDGSVKIWFFFVSKINSKGTQDRHNLLYLFMKITVIAGQLRLEILLMKMKEC
jgi:hypothetical protein